MPDEVVVLEPGDDRAKLIAKAMASQTASNILGVLRNSEYTSSEIADSLSLPITTVSYHIDNLVKADIIEVVRTRWSPKGRQVKIYGIRDQVVIVAPGKMDLRALLLKYASLFSILVVTTVLLAVIIPAFSGVSLTEEPARENLEVLKAPSVAGSEEDIAYAQGYVQPEQLAMESMLFAFFAGGCVVLLVLTGYELYVHYREQRQEKS